MVICMTMTLTPKIILDYFPGWAEVAEANILLTEKFQISAD